MSVPKCALIVDDYPRVRKAFRTIFDANGFTVCGEAVDGREVIEKARELRPDLILLDLSMPVANGLEAARELKKIMPERALGDVHKSHGHDCGRRSP